MNPDLPKTITKDSEKIGHAIKLAAGENPGQASRINELIYLGRTPSNSKDNEKVYLGLLKHLVDKIDNTEIKSDRTGTGTVSSFGLQCVYDLRKGFPLLTSKKMSWKSILLELIWILSGSTDNGVLAADGVGIWKEWANERGELGPIYGKMWREWGPNCIDQIANIIHLLKVDPDSRRILVTGWDPSLLPDTTKSHRENIANGKQVLPPCHTLWQIYTENIPQKELIKILAKSSGFSSRYLKRLATSPSSYDTVKVVAEEIGVPTRYIDLKLYQRSGDVFLGVPYNVASYSALLMILGYISGMIPRHFIHSFGDVHLYSNHIEQAKTQLTRPIHESPLLKFGGYEGEERSLGYYLANKYTCLVMTGYQHEEPISAPVAV